MAEIFKKIPEMGTYIPSEREVENIDWDTARFTAVILTPHGDKVRVPIKKTQRRLPRCLFEDGNRFGWLEVDYKTKKETMPVITIPVSVKSLKSAGQLPNPMQSL